MHRRGFSIVELLIVLVIMSILLAIATLNWNRMHAKSAIESQIKTMYADLMEFRLQALYSKTPRSAVITGNQFNLYATTDTSAAPVVSKQLTFPIVWNNNSSGLLTFDAQGLTTYDGSLCILPTNDTTVVNSAAVDSIVISQARINLGWRNGGDCKSDNIVQK